MELPEETPDKTEITDAEHGFNLFMIVVSCLNAYALHQSMTGSGYGPAYLMVLSLFGLFLSYIVVLIWAGNVKARLWLVFKHSLMINGLVFIAMGIAMNGPSAQTENDTVNKSGNMISASVDSVNYMHDWAVKYTLTDLRSNQAIGGSIVDFLDGPGGKNCCISLPKQWQPGMYVSVDWQEADKTHTKPDKYHRELEIPRYQQPGGLYVLFHPMQEVELVVSSVEPGYPGWPGKIKKDAMAACVERLSEKECKRNLPKYAPNSNESLARGYRESCLEVNILDTSDPEGNRKACQKFVENCKKDWDISDKKMCELDYKED
ncbi:DUF3304 domain-containing protein [Iodobacter fluviatilis]|uniref:Protein of uncharacterized function (DUF3304) n=1 Tax=Iodobacter fluviatilis TaxID=537 RepID=A0A377Q6K2_9NEIS|nr:DUF3304 domain-containing protein [Iodobacter fluviatilis]TCU89094.1 uncharacterized protein DUF3304 [Iodobacter fluviatilis]STQ90462.1 Protein of uncharacterised function (DUF3304) [Iodobacter fluviatilis]